GGGGRTVIVEINPRDVVAIPVDYGNAKGRCCRYTVVGEIETGKDEHVPEDHTFGTALVTGYDSHDRDSGDWVSKDEAAEILCGDALDPAGALRKRISRGTLKTDKSVSTGETLVQLP
ncbi:hypothetical protein LCGC14_2036440, partial [marine sediment metagenome]